MRKCQQEKKVKFALSEAEVETAQQKENSSIDQHNQDEQNDDDSDDLHLIMKERGKIKNISPLLNSRDELQNNVNLRG